MGLTFLRYWAISYWLIARSYERPLRGIRHARAATARLERLWDFAVIPYVIDEQFAGEQVALFERGMKHWQNKTCVRFVQRDPAVHPNYIFFTEKACGCCSAYVGKRGNGMQEISLPISENCDQFGTVIHELGHAIGFYHEQARPDRDKFVKIHYDRIIPGHENDFKKLTKEEVNTMNLSYDYDSIMHYGRKTFSRGIYLDTMTTKNGREIGQRGGLSKGDIMQTNILYKCPTCGRTLQEIRGEFSYEGTSWMETRAFDESDNNVDVELEAEKLVKCEWRIFAPKGHTIRVDFTSFGIPVSHKCADSYVEIRDGYWHFSRLLGRICGSGHIPHFTSSDGSALITAAIIEKANSKVAPHFSATYEVICGGELKVSESCVVQSPNYPNDYLPNSDCLWIASTQKGFQLSLSFQLFQLEPHDSCQYDYIEIRDGPTNTSRLIDTFCGEEIPATVNSTSDSLYIRFVSDDRDQLNGFSFTLIKTGNEIL